MSDTLSKFMNIWEVETHFKCPVVGTMLSVEKHKSILKKCGYNVKKMKAYEYHQQIMSKLSDENNVSIKVNNFIRSAARKMMIQIKGCQDKEIKSLWNKQLKTGNVGPLMYAVISYEDTGIELLQDVFGEVHMQAHANMTEIFRVRQKQQIADENLCLQKKRMTDKNKNFKTITEARKDDTKLIDLLRNENLKMQKRIKELENHFQPENNKDNTILHLEKRIKDLEQFLEADQDKLRIKEREKRSLEIDLFSSRNETTLIKKEFQLLVAGFKNCSSPDCSDSNCDKDECPQYQLCAQRVFMIGGITKMKSFYRDIVENAGGEFDYHDGYIKNTNANLEAKVKRCDVVLCPVNCNSHNACLKVKKLCNRYNKPLKILSSSSLSAVSQALFIPENEAFIN